MKTFAAAALALIATSVIATDPARADMPFTHPAIATRMAPTLAVVQARDANPQFVGHPASPHWLVVHANHEYPAVTQARLAAGASIDANTFLVQPPASVQWTLGPARNDLPTVAKQ
jgi:hypothetical protein